MTKSSENPASWHVYILRCSDNSLYTGITNNLERRLDEHNGERSNGARYTRSRRPVRLVYDETAANRQVASRREAKLKSLSKAAKEKLLTGN